MQRFRTKQQTQCVIKNQLGLNSEHKIEKQKKKKSIRKEQHTQSLTVVHNLWVLYLGNLCYLFMIFVDDHQRTISRIFSQLHKGNKHTVIPFLPALFADNLYVLFLLYSKKLKLTVYPQEYKKNEYSREASSTERTKQSPFFSLLKVSHRN